MKIKTRLKQVWKIAACLPLLSLAVPAAAQRDSVRGYFVEERVADFISSCFRDTYDSVRVFKIGIADTLCVRNALNTADIVRPLYAHCYSNSRLAFAPAVQRIFSQKLIYADAIMQRDGSILNFGCLNAFDNRLIVFLFFDGEDCVMKLWLCPDSGSYSFYYGKNGVSCVVKESCINDIGWKQFNKLFPH